MADRGSTTVLAAALALGLAGGLAGCNTVEGMGRDVTATGNWISDTFDSSDRPQEPAVTPQVPTGTSATSGPTGTSATSGSTGSPR